MQPFEQEEEAKIEKRLNRMKAISYSLKILEGFTYAICIFAVLYRFIFWVFNVICTKNRDSKHTNTLII